MPVKTRKRGRSSARSSRASNREIALTSTDEASKACRVNTDEASNGSSHHYIGASKKVLAESNGAEEVTTEGFPNSIIARTSDAPHVVMQCGSCRTILADTTLGFLEANKGAGTISCSSVRNVSLSPDIETTTSGIHASCTYRKMTCKHCGELVGRRFVSTTTQFDAIRGAFTFHKAKLFTYELGANAGDTSSDTLSSRGEGFSKPNENALRSLEELLSSINESMNGLWTKMAALEKENIELRRNFLALERKLQVDEDVRMV